MSISEITSAGCRVLIVPWTYRNSFQSNVTITLFFHDSLLIRLPRHTKAPWRVRCRTQLPARCWVALFPTVLPNLTSQ